MDKLNDSNFYNGIKKGNADICIFNEVIESKNIVDGIESICPDKYKYKYNEKEFT